MLDDIEQQARIMIMEIMFVLFNHNIKQVHIGGLLRLMGVSEEKARESDGEYVQLDEKFAKYVSQMMDLSADTSDTVH